MFLTRLKIGVAAVVALGTAAVGTRVVARPAPDGPRDSVESTARGAPEVPPVAQAAERLALAAAGGLSDPLALDARDLAGARSSSLREYEVLIAHARQVLQRREGLSKRNQVPKDDLDEARFDLELLEARRDAAREDLSDELERLEARLRVKKAEADAARNQMARMAQLEAQKTIGTAEAGQAKANSIIRDAEVMEVEVRIKQVRRRLGLK